MSDTTHSPSTQEIRRRAYDALGCADATRKAAATRTLLSEDFVDIALQTHVANTIPGRPARPALVSPKALARRSLATQQGRATLIHAIAHIEFNAINLALDVISRFPDTSDEFVLDWARVASEEALHFSLLQTHLKHLGYDYGDFPAHNGLWEMAEKTQSDLLARLALVPRTLEARGLDVSPAMRDKLAQAGDARAAEILDVILRDEIGHVAIGNKWFRFYCQARGIDPLTAFDQLSTQFDAPTPRGPFNVDARLKAGFVQEEIDRLIEKSKR